MKKSASIFGFFAILGSVVLDIWYGAWRLYVHFGGAPLWLYRIGMILAVIYVFSMFKIVFIFQNKFVTTIGIIAGYLAVFVPFLTFSLGLVHIAMLAIDVSLILSGLFAVAIAFALTLVGVVLGNMIFVRKTEIKIPKLEHQVTIMQISDAHIGVLYGEKHLSKIVKKTNLHNPDIVVVTGDLTETKAALKQKMLRPLSGLNAVAYFVEGNHDTYTGLDGVLDEIRKQNVRVLHNEMVKTHGIQLVGLDYLKADEGTYDMHAVENRSTVKSVLSKMKIDPALPAVVAIHNATGVEYAEAAGVDLMISGHTHRGQVFPFTLLTKMAYHYNGGLYDTGKTKIFVSGGAGGVVCRMRLGSVNEINLLKLVPENVE
ncbi:MAG: metallophosphoesterase [Oscillospiraceae bacterium]|nr:metallophosphoesterase [Oscillospiraceae bacterium]